MISWAKPGLISINSPLYPTLLLIGVLIISFLSVLATVITIMGADNIQGELALSDSLTTWLTTLNLLGINTTVPAASWFADRFGYKRIFSLGIALFTLASLLAGSAVNFSTIAAARFIEGIGSGLIFPVGLSLIAKTMPPARLPLALSLYILSIFGAGFALGLPLCGYVIQYSSWRNLFYLIAPFSFLSFIFCLLFQDETDLEKSHFFDYKGFISFAFFVGFLLIALTYGPMNSTDAGWRSPFILFCFAIAFLSFFAMIFFALRHRDPLIPLSLFAHPIYAVTCIAMFLLGMSIFATASTIIDYMVHSLSYDRFMSGKIGVTYGVSLAFFSIFGNLLIKKVPVPIVTFIGLSLLVYSYFLNSTLDWLTGPSQIFPILLLRGMGLGLALGPATIEGLRYIPKELASKGATFLTFFRQVGGTYGGVLISILLIKRKVFHLARFAEQIQSELPGYQVTFQKLLNHYQSSFLSSAAESRSLAEATLIKNIENQAYIAAMNDALIVFGYVTLTIAFLLIFLNLHYFLKQQKNKGAS